MRWAELTMIKFAFDENGATAIEYGMLLAGVSIIMSVALVSFSDSFVAASALIVDALSFS